MLRLLMIFLPMFICAIFSIQMALKQWQRPSGSRGWLIAWCSATAILYFCHARYFLRLTSGLPLVDTIYCMCNLASYPLFCIYLLRIVHRQNLPLHVPFLLLAPSLLGGLTITVLYLLMSHQEVIAFTQTYLYNNSMAGLSGLPWWQAAVHNLCKVIFAVNVIGVGSYSIRLIQHYEAEVAINYSDADSHSLRHVRTALYLVLVVSLLSFVANIVGKHLLVDAPWLRNIFSLLFSSVIFMLAWQGLQLNVQDHETPLTVAELTALEEAEPATPTTITGEKLSGELIIHTIKKQKLFLNQDLKLNDLAAAMNTNRSYLGLAIKQMGTTFAELINRERIEEATVLLTEHPDWSMNEVATLSGFASLSTFYRNFLQFKGCTPRDYQK